MPQQTQGQRVAEVAAQVAVGAVTSPAPLTDKRVRVVQAEGTLAAGVAVGLARELQEAGAGSATAKLGTTQTAAAAASPVEERTATPDSRVVG